VVAVSAKISNQSNIGTTNTSGATKGMRPSQAPEVFVNLYKHPEIAKVNKLQLATATIPIIAAPLMLLGLIARFLMDKQFDSQISQTKEKEAKEEGLGSKVLRFFRDLYPYAGLAMMTCGFLNGLSFPSTVRMGSYGFMIWGFLSNLIPSEQKRSKAQDELLKASSLPDSPEKEAQTKHWQEELSAATANLAHFAKFDFPLGMFFTFFANITQQCHKNASFKSWITGKEETYRYSAIKAMAVKDFCKQFQENLIPNTEKELRAGIDFTGKLFSPKNWSDLAKGISGKDQAFEKELTDDFGVPLNSWKRNIARIGHPSFSTSATMLNGLVRLVSVGGMELALSHLGGVGYMNNGSNVLTDEQKRKYAKLKKDNPQWAGVYDSCILANNLGVGFMGLCSASSAVNPSYLANSGDLAAFFQGTTGILYTAGAISGQLGGFWFLVEQATKLFGNSNAMLANVSSTMNSAYKDLNEAEILKNDIVNFKRERSLSKA